jgi:hypothetical protein
MKTKKSKWFMTGMLILIAAFIFSTVGCATAPAAGSVKLDFGGTLPPEILSYFDENQLKDIEAKFIVVQGGLQVDGMLGPSTVNTAILITVGKDYRIAQMSRYIKPVTDYSGKVTPGKHQKETSLYIVPNMATRYNTLQEAQLASEMGA